MLQGRGKKEEEKKVISAFHGSINEIFGLLGCYVALIGRYTTDLVGQPISPSSTV